MGDSVCLPKHHFWKPKYVGYLISKHSIQVCNLQLCLPFYITMEKRYGSKTLNQYRVKTYSDFSVQPIVFCCLVEQFLMEKKRKNELIFLDREDFDFL